MRFTLPFLLCAAMLSAQEYPKDFFKSPLDIPLFLAGNFGELRTNHFHAGLDFKTQQKEGFNVYAAADGYVSRIKISTFGYGKALYITHPNGFTTVYGHLQKAIPLIDAYIKANHYRLQSFEMDLQLKPDELIIKQGDIIGISGNTGGSGGPHLHFEVRDTKTEEIINPLNFGFDKMLTDTQKPEIRGLIVYPISDQATANGSQLPQILSLSLQKDGTYLAEKVAASGTISFGICSYDFLNGANDTNGLYKVQSYLNGNPTFGYQFDRFSFDQGRYVNALLDYPRFVKTGVRYQKLFMKNPYPFEPIHSDNSNGMIDVQPNLDYTYKIEIADFNGNNIVINVPIKYSNATPKVLKKEIKTDYFLKADRDNMYQKGKFSVFVPANAFYEDLNLNFDVQNDTLTFQDETVALQKDIAIRMQANENSDADSNKTCLALVDGKKLNYSSTKKDQNTWVTYTKNLGQYVLTKDTVQPIIKPLNFYEGQWLSQQKDLQLMISDSFSGIKTYNGYLNGKWILFEYDYKTKKITHLLDSEFLLDGRNDLCLSIADSAGNTTTLETFFYYKKQ